MVVEVENKTLKNQIPMAQLFQKKTESARTLPEGKLFKY